MHALDGQFSGIWSVLSHDPVHIIKVYLRDLYSLPGQLFRGDQLFAYPVNVMIGCAAIFWVFVATRSKWMLALALVSGLHILLVNFKAYEPRFYIFLVPLFGATLVAVEAGPDGVRHQRGGRVQPTDRRGVVE